MIYSSYDTFNRVLDDPESHGFTLPDIGKKGGAIWRDDLHPTSAMHDIIAKDIAQFLDDQPSFVAGHSRCVVSCTAICTAFIAIQLSAHWFPNDLA
jgi:phospholipase/lecithinase/hemolysin